jgi:predicted MFS family arabinose efflux permease
MRAGNGAALAALGVTQIASWGPLYYAFSVLMKPMQAELGWSRDLLVGGHAVALLVWGLAAYPTGRLIDRYGGRLVMSVGSMLAALAFVVLANAHSVAVYYAAWVVAGVAMALCLYEAAFTVLTIAYRERSRWAITVLTLAGGFASTVFWPITQMLVDAFGWREAVLWLAAVQFVLCLPLHAFALPGAARVAVAAPVAGKKAVGHAWLRSPAFWLLAVSFTANSFVTAAVSVHVIALLGERGLAASDAVWLGALIGPMQFSGRLMEFLFGKRLPATGVGTATVLLLPASLVILMVAGASVPVLLGFVLLYGAGLGLYTIVRATTPAELFGRDNFGALNGALAAPSLFARAAGPIGASFVVTASGGYGAALWMLLAVTVAGALSYWVAVARKA